MTSAARNDQRQWSGNNVWATPGTVRDKTISALVQAYAHGSISERCLIAKMCDESLDRSGNLLGVVRTEAENVLGQTP